MIYGESIKMKMKRTALATAIVLTVAGGPVLAKTSTVASQFILDKTEIATGSEATINLSLLGLDKNGKVDLEGEKDGSIIIAVIETELGEINGGDDHPGVSATDSRPDEGYLAAQLRYIKLVQGKGQVSITYRPEDIGESVKTDIVKVRLQERIPTTGGGVSFVDIGEMVEKTITINPPSIDPVGLRIAGFKPASVDPRGQADCYTETDLSGDIVSSPAKQKDGCGKAMFSDVTGIDDDAPTITTNSGSKQFEGLQAKDNGIQAQMIAGQEGAQILVLADNPNAAGEVTVTLTSGDIEYLFSDRMMRGQAILTLDKSVTKSRTYYMKATFEGFDGSSVGLVYKDTLEVWSTGIPRGLELTANKERIAMADFDKLSDPNSQVTQGAELTVQLLDEYGNSTTNCAPSINSKAASIYPCTTDDKIRIAIENATDTLLTLEVAKGSVFGQAEATGVGANSDMILGNSKGEVDINTSLNLTAKAIDGIGNPIATINKSEGLAIKVVLDSLQVTNVFMADMLAGVEFDFAAVKVIDSMGNVKTLADQSGTVDPGAIILKNMWTEEDIQVNRKAEGNDLVQGLFKEATFFPTQFLVSDRAGTYGEVWVHTPAILPAAASEVSFLDAHGEERQNVKPTKTSDGQQYVSVLPEVAFKMSDTFGNPISETGELRVTSSNTASIDYRTLEGKDYAIPGRKEPVSGYRYTHVALFYDSQGMAAFAGEDNIEVNFTKPGLGSDVLTIGAEIPGSRKLGSIASYIETTDIPVNSVVAMTVETLDENDLLLADNNTTVTITLGGEVGDTLTPRVAINEGLKKDETGTVVVDDETGEVTKLENSSVSTGQSVSFESGRVVFVIDAGSREGIFSIKFADANSSIAPKVVTFNVTEKIEILQVSPSSVEVASTETASVTITGGLQPYDVASAEDSIASATLEADGTTVTITGETTAGGETSVTVTDDRGGTSNIAVTVTAAIGTPEDCNAEGYVFVDGECKQLPSTNGTSEDAPAPTIKSDGTFGTSDAKFSGGWSEDGAAYGGTVPYDAKAGKPVSVTQVIRFDPNHSGEVDIVVLLDIHLHAFGPDLWFVVSLTAGFPPWDLSMDSIVPFDTHTIVSGEPLVLGPYDLGTGLKDFLASDIKFYFGYRTSDGEVIFSGNPINLQVR